MEKGTSEEFSKKENCKKLSIEQLRSYEGCENLTDEEAKEVIEGIEELCIMLFQRFQNLNRKQYGEFD